MTSETQTAEQQPDHYDAFADAYGRANENGLFNRWYARPAVLDLLGDVAGRRILDAGCGSGRTAAALFGRGHFVVGVDVDPVLVAAAEEDHPGPQWLVADLAGLDLRSRGYADSFDMIVCAGNVMSYVAAGTEIAVLSGFREHLAPQGRAVIGFQGDRYAVGDFDGHVAAAGLVLEQRFATWDLRPWHREAEFVVSVIAPA